MCLRRWLSIGLATTLLACDVGLSGLESVSLKPPVQGGAAEPPVLDASSSEQSGETRGDGPADAAGPLPARGSANSAADAGVTTSRMTAPNPADGAVDSAESFVDADVVAHEPIGCPDRAACPADEVCCALFEDGGYVPAFDDAGAIETSCRPSCTAGTTPLCATNADCGDAGTCFNPSPTTSPRGFCVPPYFPRYPYGDSGH
jgi:hypothetical protein